MLQLVTGAFGYSGKYIARRLLAQGHQVITLTGHLNRPDPFDGAVRAAPFNFENPAALTATLRGVEVLYNTYWVRFDHGETTFAKAVANTRTLIQAAKEAGVRRFVHVSIANPSLDSPLPYYRGKAELEEAIKASGLSYAILRPTVIFGDEDILINNIAYLLRRFPLFAIPGSGDYRVQPIFVEDMAELAVRLGAEEENRVVDAVGPEIYTFKKLVAQIRTAVGSRARLIHLPPGVLLLIARVLGRALNDVILTPEEIRGLMTDLLVSSAPPTGKTSFAAWLQENSQTVGLRYASELQRHYKAR